MTSHQSHSSSLCAHSRKVLIMYAVSSTWSARGQATRSFAPLLSPGEFPLLHCKPGKQLVLSWVGGSVMKVQQSGAVATTRNTGTPTPTTWTCQASGCRRMESPRTDSGHQRLSSCLAPSREPRNTEMPTAHSASCGARVALYCC